MRPLDFEFRNNSYRKPWFFKLRSAAVSRGRLLVFTALLSFCCLPNAQATTSTWTGGDGGNSWATGSPSKANWGGTAWANGNDAIFAGIVRTNGPDIGSTAVQAASITFDNTAGPFTIKGTATLTISGGVVNNDADTQSFTVTTVTLGAGQTWNAASGNLSFSGTTLNLGASQTLTIDGANTTTIGNAIGGTGTSGITKNGTGSLTLTGANTYAGTTTINAGTVNLSGGSAISDSGAISMANVSGAILNLSSSETIGSLSGGGTTGGNVTLNANTLTVGDTTSPTYAGVISGSGGVTKQGSGTLTLTGANTYGATTISSGTLQIGAGGTVGSLGTGTVTDNSALAFNRSDAVTVGNTINGSGTVSYSGGGTYTVNGANGYTGSTTINSASTVQLGSPTALGTTAAGTTVSSGTVLDLNGKAVVGEAVGISGTGISSGGALINSSGTAASLSGTVTLNAASRINSTGGMTLSGGITAGVNALTIGGSGNVTISTAAIAGSGASLTYDGTGTLNLNVNNSYTGGTTLSGGTVSLGTTGALPSSGNVAFSSGKLALNNLNVTGSGTLGALSLTANSVLQLDSVSATHGSITFASASRTGGILSIYQWQGGVGTAGTDDRIFITGTATVGFLNNVQFYSDNGVTLIGSSGRMLGTELVPSATAVPEPINIALAVFGSAFGLIGIGRRCLRGRAASPLIA